MRHTLDVMHMEKNVASTLMNFILGNSHTIAMRQDLEAEGIMHHLHLVKEGQSNNYSKPHAPYVLPRQEQRKVLQSIRSTRTPTGHCANFRKLVSLEEKLQFMKTHHWHILMQEILPAAIRNPLPKGPRVTIIRLGHCFRRICAKFLRQSELPQLQNYVVETLTLMEIHFPSTF